MLNRLQLLVLVTSFFSVSTVSTAWATPLATNITTSESSDQAPATTVTDWIAQIEASLVQITDVRIEPAATGLSILLETTGGELATTTEVVSNALIVTVPNAVLALPDGEPFEEFAPVEGVALVSLTSRGDQVQVVITGTDAPPVVDVVATGTGLALGVTPGVAQIGETDEAIQITALGEDTGYVADDASTATRTDTPLRDIPQSIQVVPQQVLEDQQVGSVSEALRNVSGVNTDDSFGGSLDRINIRGFQSDVFLENGFRRGSFNSTGLADIELIERLEVLKGPASVLYGNIEPGGVVNVITERPLSIPEYTLEGTVGSFGLLRPSIDLTGPLDANGRILYRLNALYETEDGFRDYDQDLERFVLAPSLTFNLSDRTSLDLNLSYVNQERPFDRGIPAIGDEVADVPFDRLFQDPDAVAETEEFSASYRLTHAFNDNWQLRNEFRYLSIDTFDFRIESWIIEDDGTLDRRWRSNDDYSEFYSLQTNVVGEFNTGSIEHTLLAGVDWNRSTGQGGQRRLPGDPSFFLNIFTEEGDPISRPDLDDMTLLVRNSTTRQDNIGFYLQDQIALTDNLQILAGGRFDIFDFESVDSLDDTETGDTVERFTPRIGIV